ncbi:MAG TPA: hypothetical protein DCL54_03310 [Alphaproteobacteria bacterium]|nr:hypothetical protein [Alphaproteobacteria bacterium]
MELITTIGLGLGFVLAGFGIVATLYFAFYHLLPSVDRAMVRALFSDADDEHASKWDQRNG